MFVSIKKYRKKTLSTHTAMPAAKAARANHAGSDTMFALRCEMWGRFFKPPIAKQSEPVILGIKKAIQVDKIVRRRQLWYCIFQERATANM